MKQIDLSIFDELAGQETKQTSLDVEPKNASPAKDFYNPLEMKVLNENDSDSIKAKELFNARDEQPKPNTSGSREIQGINKELRELERDFLLQVDKLRDTTAPSKEKKESLVALYNKIELMKSVVSNQ